MSDLFLAEATVVIRPDTTAFRAELLAQVTAATAAASKAIPPVLVPVGVSGGPALAAQSAAVQQATAHLQTLAATTSSTTAVTTKATAASKAKTEAQRLEARAAVQLGVAQEQVLNSTSALGAAQIQATRSAAALANARRAVAALTAADSVATRDAAINTLRLAEAQNIEAAAALRAASAQAKHAQSLASVARGAGASVLSLAGIRGATLAANATFLAGAAAAVTFFSSVKLAADFNTQLNVFRVTAEATGVEMQRVAEQARALGVDITLPGVGAVDAAESMTELAKAGLSVTDSLEGARGVLQLATAAGIDNAAAVELAASALNAFGLAGEDATRVADVFANAANDSQGSIEDVGLAFQQAASVARLSGVSFEDTATLLTILARAGLKGSDAGTSLRTSFLRLLNPTAKAKAILDETNIALRDMEGNIRPEVFAEFTLATEKLGRAQQDAATAVVFGQDAIRAASILGRTSVRDLDVQRESIEKVGTAAELAGARSDGLRGKWEKLKNTGSDLGLSIGQNLDGPLEGFIDGVQITLEGVDKLNKAFERTEDSAPDFAALAVEAGMLTNALSIRGDDAGEGLRKSTEAAVAALNDAQSAGIAGASAVEGYAQANRDAAAQAEGLNNRLDESRDRFASLPTAIDSVTSALTRTQAAMGQIAGLEEAADRARAAGNRGAELSALRGQAVRQQRIIDAEGPSAEGDSLKRRREAQKELARVNGQIRSIEEEMTQERERAASEARQRATEAQQAIAKADRAFLDLVRGRVGATDNRILAAEATAGLNDDIAAEKNKRAVLRRQIELVKETVKDLQLRKAEIQRLVREDIEARNAISALREQQRENEREQRKKDALAAQERRDAVTESLAKRTLLAELRGNDPAQLAALNAQIADARRRVALAKKAKKGIVDEQIALQELINARKELIKQAEEESADVTGGTTLVDLFNRAEDIVSGAGNVGFSAAGLQGLSARGPIKQEVQQRLDIVNNPAVAAAARQERSNNLLIQAIDRLTLAMTGNTATGGPITRREQNQWRNLSDEQRFFYQKQAKMMVEQGLTG